jgi:molybdopterin synthase catalytic subunit
MSHQPMFEISSTPIDIAALSSELHRGRAGACVTFEGWVRDSNEGRPVTALEYEAYIPLAEKEGLRIVSEAMEKYPVLAVVCTHRTGVLAVGDLAVWIGVISQHRSAAFDACRYVIDEAKARLPIWKRERYADGSSEWINCATRGGSASAKP